MYANRRSKIGGLCLMTALMAACMATPGPKGWLPSPKEALSDAFGAWMIVKYASNTGEKTAEGEFIAVEKNKVYLLTEMGPEEIPTPKVLHVIYATYKEKRISPAWTILGLLSTASHGAWAVISAPIWLITGIIHSSAESTSGITESDSIAWEEIRKYARFPQGIPQGMDLRLLKHKPHNQGTNRDNQRSR